MTPVFNLRFDWLRTNPTSSQVYQASGLLLGQVKAMLDIEFDDDSQQYIWDIQENLVVDREKIETSWASTYFSRLATDR